MRSLPLLFFLLFIFLVSPQAQSQSSDCTGAGCCCNVQAGGKWPDCAEGYECRGMPTPPYMSVCIKKGSPPQAPLFLASNQPAGCKRADDSNSEKKPEEKKQKAVSKKTCHGTGCCCLSQSFGQWPDCDPGFECRQATQKPYFKVCVKKGAPANTPLQIAPNQPANCFQRYESGDPSRPGKGHPFCEQQPNSGAKEWCRRHLVNPPNIPKSMMRRP